MEENNEILAQVPFPKHELDDIFAQAGNTTSLSSASSFSTSSSSTILTAPEVQSIFKCKEKVDPNWLVDKVSRRKDEECCTYPSTIPEVKLSLSAIGYYITPKRTFAIERTFYFCLMKSCVSRTYFMLSIAIPPPSVSIASFTALTEKHIDIIRQHGFNIV